LAAALDIATVKPMLGRLTRTLPEHGHLYEPKWDGFRALALRIDDVVELKSRHGRPFARYFPELVAGLRALPAERCLLDGEILVHDGRDWDFTALMARLHPAASRVERLAAETPAILMAFDLLMLDGDDLTQRPFSERRRVLEEVLHDAPASLRLSPQTDDPEVARGWLTRPADRATDGVMAKAVDGRYEPGARAMLKVKLERTADCVIAGLRGVPQPEPTVTSLLLGLYDAHDTLRHVGVASSFGRARGRELFERLRPLATGLEGHPWEQGFLLEGGALGRLKGAAGRWAPGMPMDWLPLRPVTVCEVAYDRVDDDRFRHPARLRRFREDREPASCRFDQLAEGDAAPGGP
jgi:ATP-dependent DNA ligase